MSGSVKWNIGRKELGKDPMLGRNHNPEKFHELGELIDGASNRAKSEYRELAIRMCRKILEEIANIVQHNNYWDQLSVKTDLNTSRTKFKFTIKYDGGGYYDPSKFKTIMDDGNFFAKYSREHSIQDSDVIIKICIDFVSGDQNEIV